jgi:hypothetical protein
MTNDRTLTNRLMYNTPLVITHNKCFNEITLGNSKYQSNLQLPANALLPKQAYQWGESLPETPTT